MIKTIQCKDCENDFTITDEEIEWYKSKLFDLPKRCSSCREKRKQNGASRY
ncbi:MAG: zinc-ribbon domain containing protein [Patescibacteria group bacterium]